VHVIDSVGARLVRGQLTFPSTLSSVSAIPVTVTLPVFVTRYEYATTAGAERPAVVDDLTTDRRGARTAVTVAWDWFESMPPACARAVFVIEPASRSACVIVWLAVQVFDAKGAMSPAGQVTVALSSLTVTGPVRVTVSELFVTT
jgi:hypothetical protein